MSLKPLFFCRNLVFEKCPILCSSFSVVKKWAQIGYIDVAQVENENKKRASETAIFLQESGFRGLLVGSMRAFLGTFVALFFFCFGGCFSSFGGVVVVVVVVVVVIVVIVVVVVWGTGGILFREYCFGEENSLSSAANSVSSARNSVLSRLHTNNRLKGTHWVRSLELNEPKKTHWVRCLKPYSPKPYSACFRLLFICCCSWFLAVVVVVVYLFLS